MRRNGHIRSGASALILAGLMILTVIAGGASAETTLEPWACEGGWAAFPLVMQKEELNDAWEEGAKSFGAALGLEGLDGAMLKGMLLQGYGYETHFDNLAIDGSKVTVTSKDGEKVFSYEYEWAETLENAMSGTAVQVFLAKDANAGAFTYLCMTEPNTRGDERGGYTTFNLFHFAKDYKAAFEDKENVQIPCMMIRTDTTLEGMATAIRDIFASPAVIVK